MIRGQDRSFESEAVAMSDYGVAHAAVYSQCSLLLGVLYVLRPAHVSLLAIVHGLLRAMADELEHETESKLVTNKRLFFSTPWRANFPIQWERDSGASLWSKVPPLASHFQLSAQEISSVL